MFASKQAYAIHTNQCSYLVTFCSSYLHLPWVHIVPTFTKKNNNPKLATHILMQRNLVMLTKSTTNSTTSAKTITAIFGEFSFFKPCSYFNDRTTSNKMMHAYVASVQIG